jgi:glutathionyl-hydroquinone reductase
VRFDAVYYVHFKCNLRRLVDYSNPWAYARDLYQTPGFGETLNFDHIKRHYYMTHDKLNPSRIVPKARRPTGWPLTVANESDSKRHVTLRVTVHVTPAADTGRREALRRL